MTSINPNFVPKLPIRIQKNENNLGNGEEKASNDNGVLDSNRKILDGPLVKVPVDTLIANNGIKIGTGKTMVNCNSEPEVHEITPDEFERIQEEGHQYPENDYVRVRFAEYTCEYCVDKWGNLCLASVKPHE